MNYKNVSPPKTCCSSNAAQDSFPGNTASGHNTQGPCPCNNIGCTTSTCADFDLDNQVDEDLCPMFNLAVKSQNNMASCSQIRSLNKSLGEKIQQLPQMESCRQCNLKTTEKLGSLQSQNESKYEPYHTMSTNEVPMKKSCDLCCSGKLRLDKNATHLGCDNSSCPTAARIQGNLSVERQKLHNGSKQLCESPPMSTIHPQPKRQGSAIASEVNQTLLATLPKQTKEQKIKKRKSSKTSIKSNKSVVSETCSCKEEPENECLCHFPPAYSEFFSCTGNITGTCYCSKK